MPDWQAGMVRPSRCLLFLARSPATFRAMPDEPLRNQAAGYGSGVIRLGQLAGRIDLVEVACNRCPRRGRLRLSGLLDQHGPGMPVPELLRVLSADCPRQIADKMHDRCGAHLPGLAGLRW